MKCALCGRGLTYRRIARDSALLVYDEREEPTPYCGGCVERGKVKLPEGWNEPPCFAVVLMPRAIVKHELHPDKGELRYHYLSPADP